MLPLGGRRVLEISSASLAVSEATALLASLGAEVWKLESDPVGDPLRRQRPLVETGGQQLGAAFAGAGAGKLFFGLRLAVEAAGPLLARLASSADLVVTSDPYFDSPDSVTVYVTPFGRSGPRRDRKASGPSLFHASGPGFVTPRAPQDGASGETVPRAPWGHVAERLVAPTIAATMLAALRAGAGAPRRLDISIQDCLLPLMRREFAAWQYDGYKATRSERLWKIAPSGFYGCADGYVYASVVENRQWHALCRISGHPELVEDPRLATPESRFEHLDVLESALSPWFARHTIDEVFALCGPAGIPAGPVYSPQRLLASEHMRARTHSAAGVGAPLPLRRTGAGPMWRQLLTAVPQPGRDTHAVLSTAGLSETEIAAARASGATF